MLCAFSVVLTTLVVQGMTLRPLLVWLGMKDDGEATKRAYAAPPPRSMSSSAASIEDAQLSARRD